jgi:V-type H+-transporting ATPase subunit E
MIRLLEEEVYIKIRKEDLNLVKTLLEECQSEFEEIMMKETKKEYKTKLLVMEDVFLSPEEGKDCGGVILTNKNKKIVCFNTL